MYQANYIFQHRCVALLYRRNPIQHIVNYTNLFFNLSAPLQGQGI